jgi:hypothetical protein
MDVSKLTEKPAGRKPIQTITVPLERPAKSSAGCGAVAERQEVYWICPLVEESEELDLMSAEERMRLVCVSSSATGRPHPRPHERRGKGRGDDARSRAARPHPARRHHGRSRSASTCRTRRSW